MSYNFTDIANTMKSPGLRNVGNSSQTSMDPLSLALGGASAVGNVVSSLFTNAANKRENKRNRWFAHQEAEINRNWQAEQAQIERDYNSPANQKKMMQEAGFNPALMFGDVAGVAQSSNASASGSQASAPSSLPSHAPSFDPASVASLTSAFADKKLKDAQARNLDADTVGKEIENDASSFRLRIYKIYAEDKEIAGLSLTQSMVSLNNATSAEKAASTDLSIDELNNMRPLQRDDYIATIACKKQEASYTAVLEAKTHQDMTIALTQLVLSTALTYSMISDNYASANAHDAAAARDRSQVDLNAAFAVDAYASADQKNLDTQITLDKWNMVKDTIKDTLVSELKARAVDAKLSIPRGFWDTQIAYKIHQLSSLFSPAASVASSSVLK